MTAQKEILFKLISEQGWNLTQVENSAKWWIDERWLLESIWRPVGFQLELIFTVDEQLSIFNRKKGEAVDCVKISTLDNKKGISLYLTKTWRNRLPEFLKELSQLRAAEINDLFSADDRH